MWGDTLGRILSISATSIKTFPVTSSYLGSCEHAHKLHQKLVNTNKYRSRYTVMDNEVRMIKNTPKCSELKFKKVKASGSAHFGKHTHWVTFEALRNKRGEWNLILRIAAGTMLWTQHKLYRPRLMGWYHRTRSWQGREWSTYILPLPLCRSLALPHGLPAPSTLSHSWNPTN